MIVNRLRNRIVVFFAILFLLSICLLLAILTVQAKSQEKQVQDLRSRVELLEYEFKFTKPDAK